MNESHDCHISPEDSCDCQTMCEKCDGMGFTLVGEADNVWERKCVCRVLADNEQALEEVLQGD